MSLAARASLLLVEDDAALADLLTWQFERGGLDVVHCTDGNEALLFASSRQPDVVLLDWMIESLSGIEVCRQLRRLPATADVPIIMLSARDGEQDRIFGLDAGADEYVTKPFSARNLVALVDTVLGRGVRAREREVLAYADIELDPASHRVRRGRRAVLLSPTEFRLLRFLLAQPERVFSRARLLTAIWGMNTRVEPRTVDAYIRRLRESLSEGGESDLIRTVRFAGYSLDIDSRPE